MSRKLHPDILEMAGGLKSAGASNREVADLLGVNQGTAWRWVTGKKLPRVKTTE